MIRLVFILALCAVSVGAVAQRSFPVQHHVYVGGGIAVAPESLAGIESADNKGYVENGPVVALNYLAKLHRYVGIGATLGHSRNNLNAVAVASSFSSATTVKTEPYALTYLMADVYGMLPVKQWQFYVRGSAGSILPTGWEMYITNDVGSGTVKSGQHFVPAYATAAGVTYSLGRIDLGVESNLLASEPEFEVQISKSVSYRKQWLSAFNHTIKTGYRF
ncbi:hypothetical protein [Pontibacter fetidus]|uniref:Outer membrane protein beta-barrel domain-containing protein n=1 Tax=Pontibacter fetidus TaxID=2700082 RepID=A0A6B2H144_9BACT|nr:hypothetical protein [Pontibacter fetidus]NDK56825.1 hypothetical protein [Pontibacter fetidus]